MSHWQKIRDAARSLRSEVCAAYDLDESDLSVAPELLTRALEFLELYLIPEHADSANLRGALAVLEDDCIFYRSDLPAWYRDYCIAHEVAHFRLHHQSVHCTSEDIESFAKDEETASPAEKIVGYGAGERREREANLFALEFLLPCCALRRAFLEENLNASRIAEKTKMPVEMIAGQIAHALLVPVSETETVKENSKIFSLDESQRRAAETEKCPVLVSAGPGTGKTQTLTKRISYLIEKGVDPKRILALTFSSKAAEEMRERVGQENAEAAAQIQVMTFHAFGLDILRSFWREVGLEPLSALIDKIDALLYLEKHLAEINLEHYQNLSEPTMNLPAILAAISRAKDELCSPEKYRELAEKMLAEAVESEDEEEIIKAEKALETARVYEFYQRYLEREKLLDFGDLIFRAVRLLQENEGVKKELAARYDAILVDEFQDVNRACGVLLKEIAGDGKGLWAVGDLRQSIYRWRGASTANLRLFGHDFPNAETISLERNYRSHEEIVALFSRFAGKMKAAGAEFFHKWTAERDSADAEKLPAVRLEIADSLETEAENLAENIKKYRELGFSYKEQAVICRTHSQLNKFARVLSEKGIPIFYLGELFEREEVRDLLSLLDLKFSSNGHSLLRVANFPEYGIPFADVKKIIDEIAEREISFEEVLETEEINEKLSDAGREGLKKLRAHLRTFPKDISAWRFLADYLFNSSNYLKPFFDSQDVNKQSRLLAIYQFLRLAIAMEDRFSSEGEAQIPEFLSYVRKLARFGEDKNYAQIPEAAENLDAVRLMTVHSAKGLEFRTVFLPYLAAGKIPSKRKAQTCPNPKGMIEGEADYHDEEEECLFFVAMSRARDCLHLSRAEFYGQTKSSESKFLTALAEFLPPARRVESPAEENIDFGAAEEPLKQNFYAKELDLYLRCPRQYFYRNVCGLKARGELPVYLKFHSCVYDTIRSLQSIRGLNGIGFDEETAFARFEEFWLASEIDAHPYAPIYKRKAEEIVRRMCARLENGGEAVFRPTYEVRLSNGTVRVSPDAVERQETEGEKQIVVRRYRTGKAPKKKDVDDADALMFQAAKEYFSEASPLIEIIYLSDDVAQRQTVTERVVKKRLAKYEQAIDGINRKDFPAKPNDDNCPHCPHFFICPAGGEK
jgi:Superfamily I DNA and RNA helicases